MKTKKTKKSTTVQKEENSVRGKFLCFLSQGLKLPAYDSMLLYLDRIQIFLLWYIMSIDVEKLLLSEE